MFVRRVTEQFPNAIDCKTLVLVTIEEVFPMKKFAVSLLATSVILLCPLSVMADVPRLVPYQGRLTSDVGVPLGGPVNMRVVFYDAATGGTALWSEDHSSVALTNGVFFIQIGSETSGGVSDAALDAANVWLGVRATEDLGENLDNVPEQSPRTQIGMAPFSAKATSAEQLVEPGSFDPAVNVDASGFVGIGTPTPSTRLHIKGSSSLDSSILIDSTDASAGLFIVSDSTGLVGIISPDETDDLRFQTGSSDRMTIRDNGNVGIGTTNPGTKLEIAEGSSNKMLVRLAASGSGSEFDTPRITLNRWRGVGDTYSNGVMRMDLNNDGFGNYDMIFGTVGETSALDAFSERMRIAYNGNVGVGTTNPGAKLDVNGTTRTCVLEITGGCDLAEPFNISGADTIKPGMVVAIDPDRPGQLRVSDRPYDTTVAGIISGANGLAPGMVMKSIGQKYADGTHNVALTGRVWCWCDASQGAIQPGDLLTTSATPGHAMKVSEHSRASGAIIGKAMTRLKNDRGLVLVLVSLQ